MTNYYAGVNIEDLLFPKHKNRKKDQSVETSDSIFTRAEKTLNRNQFTVIVPVKFIKAVERWINEGQGIINHKELKGHKWTLKISFDNAENYERLKNYIAELDKQESLNSSIIVNQINKACGINLDIPESVFEKYNEYKLMIESISSTDSVFLTVNVCGYDDKDFEKFTQSIKDFNIIKSLDRETKKGVWKSYIFEVANIDEFDALLKCLANMRTFELVALSKNLSELSRETQEMDIDGIADMFRTESKLPDFQYNDDFERRESSEQEPKASDTFTTSTSYNSPVTIYSKPDTNEPRRSGYSCKVNSDLSDNMCKVDNQSQIPENSKSDFDINKYALELANKYAKTFDELMFFTCEITNFLNNQQFSVKIQDLTLLKKYQRLYK